MGGSRAKQRRRQQREGKESVTESVTENLNQSPRHPKRNRRTHNVNTNRTPAETKALPCTEHQIKNMLPKKKFQKPKHLYRKLQTIDPTNSHQREQILRQMKELAARKRSKNTTEAATTSTTKTATERSQVRPLAEPTRKRRRGRQDTLNGPQIVRVTKCVGRSQPATAPPTAGIAKATESSSANRKDTITTSSTAHSSGLSDNGDQSPTPAKKQARVSDTGASSIQSSNDIAGMNTPETNTSIPTAASSRDRDDTTVIPAPDASDLNNSRKNHAKADPPKNSTTRVAKHGTGADSSSDDDSVARPDQQRRRGKGRRGRKNTSQQVEEDVAMANDRQQAPQHKEQRYCVGRKPVTDFVVGQSYSGKVVYVKPFGIFLDISCHSDAFCHVSRLCDDYCDSPENAFKVGDVVPNARVVEVDRKRQRITVSLQSTARLADERASVEARQQRRAKHRTKPSRVPNKTEVEHVHTTTATTTTHPRASLASVHSTLELTPSTKPPKVRPETHQSELKRARKLARRAQRRAAKEHQEELDQ